ncbi:MAG: Rne/Rng family ribonuclease [Deltaproteobacteria bacterium]|nr:Rne/Rng family ribonuclease [Deltaproteobacteria bacterium]
MPSEILVNVTGRETRVALMENNQLVELHVDRGVDRGYVGNVYLGRVVRVLPGMQAAFVEIGLDRAAFLYVGDIWPQMFDHKHDDEGDNGEPNADEDATIAEEAAPREHPRPGQPSISDLIKEGEEIVVQVAKDPIGTKGARVTTHVTLPGRYMVFMPTVDHVGISRRIAKDKERRRLREFVDKNRPRGAGFIVRSACAMQTNQTLKQDMSFLVSTWEKIQNAAKSKKAPAPLHLDHGLVLRMVRDAFHEEVERMVVDSGKLHEEVLAFLDEFAPELKDKVHLYRGNEPIFDTFGVETEISRSLGRKVWLKSGGYLVIDQTEALMSIDVNSGKYVGQSASLEETTLKVNLEAVKEVVYQLRLRNIGGIIIIDFIDMDREQNRDKVYRAIEDELKKDRARTNVLKISDLGLVQMTRKRVQEDVVRYISEQCPVCDGRGSIRSRQTLCYDIFRELQRESVRAVAKETLFVNAHPSVADMLYGEEYQILEQVEARLGKRVVVRALQHMHPEKYEVYAR